MSNPLLNEEGRGSTPAPRFVIDAADALAFASAAHTRNGLPGQVHVTTFAPDMGPGRRLRLDLNAPGVDAHLSDFLKATASHNNYFHVGVTLSGFQGHKAGKGDIGASGALHVDMDRPDDEGAEAFETRVSRIISELDALGLSPDAIVDSGNGRHLYWWTAQFRFTGAPAAREQFEGWLKRITRAIGGDPACAEVARIMRVPGTMNWPDARKRARGRVACRTRTLRLRKYDPAVRPLETPEQVESLVAGIEAWAGSSTPPSAPHAGRGCAAVTRDANGVTVAVADDAISALALQIEAADGAAIDAARARFNELRLLSPRLMFRARGETGAGRGLPALADASRSERDMAVANLLAAEGEGPLAIGLMLLHAFEHGRGANGAARSDYVARTALKACQERETAASATEAAFRDFNERYATALIGGDFVVLRFSAPGTPPALLSKTAFLDLERPNKIRLPSGKMAPIAQLWLEWPSRRTYECGMAMCPLAPDGSGEQPPPGVFNTWMGFVTTSAAIEELDWPHIRDYLLAVLCRCDETLFSFVLDWLAQAVQRPHVKPGTALVLIGRQGAGKTTIGRLLKAIFNPAHVASVDRADALTGRFNGHLADALFVVADEAAFARDPVAQNRLKAFVTDDMMTVERKGIDSVSVRSFHRLVMTSNEDHVVRAEADARRWVVLEVSDHRAGDAAYFGALDKALQPGSAEARAFLRDLIAREVDEARLRRAPTTSGLVGQIIQSLPAPARWLFERLRDCQPGARPTTPRTPAAGFAGGLSDFSGDIEWPEHALKSSLVEDYRAWAARRRYLTGDNDNALGKALAAIGRESQARVNGGAARARVLTLGPLEEARATFARTFLRGADDPSVWGTPANDPDAEDGAA